MTKVLHTIEGFPPKELDEKAKAPFYRLRKAYEQLALSFNGLINFGDGTNRENIDGNWVSFVTPGVINTDFVVTHNLGRIPVGYIPMTKSAACDLYTGSVVATKTQITLRATAAGVTVNVFFI